MTEEQKAALRIVLDLANDNRLDKDDYEDDQILYDEAVKQEKALELIEALWTKEVDG